ncbi:MAG: ABC transporter ATP-binding protein [Chloroflexota bacterium]
MLVVDEVSVHYGRIQALDAVSLRVNRGEIVTLIGANGAGKSTLLNTIIGVLSPSAGRVIFEDRIVTGVPVEKMTRLGIGCVPEGRQIFTTMNVKDNLILGAYHRCTANWRLTPQSVRRMLTGDGIERDLESIYSLFPILGERRNQKAGSLSGGEQQMLAIGRALMSQPRLLLLDEPSMGLSPAMTKEILRLIRDLRRTGLTILLVEQNAGAALRVADRVYVLENGRIALEGTPQQLMADRRVQQAYLGGGVSQNIFGDERETGTSEKAVIGQ